MTNQITKSYTLKPKKFFHGLKKELPEYVCLMLRLHVEPFQVKVFGKFYTVCSALSVRARRPVTCSGTLKRIDCIKNVI